MARLPDTSGLDNAADEIYLDVILIVHFFVQAFVLSTVLNDNNFPNNQSENCLSPKTLNTKYGGMGQIGMEL